MVFANTILSIHLWKKKYDVEMEIEMEMLVFSLKLLILDIMLN